MFFGITNTYTIHSWVFFSLLPFPFHWGSKVYMFMIPLCLSFFSFLPRFARTRLAQSESGPYITSTRYTVIVHARPFKRPTRTPIFIYMHPHSPRYHLITDIATTNKTKTDTTILNFPSPRPLSSIVCIVPCFVSFYALRLSRGSPPLNFIYTTPLLVTYPSSSPLPLLRM